MPVLKGATGRLQKAGINCLQVKRGLWGHYLFDTRLTRQKGTTYKSWQKAVAAAMAGERPCLVVGQGVKIYLEDGELVYITITAEIGLDDLLQAVADDYGHVVIGFILMGMVQLEDIQELELPDGTRFVEGGSDVAA